MKSFLSPFVLSTLTAANFVAGAQLNVSISGFAEPQSFLDQSLELRFTELVPAVGTNAATHVLIEGLKPLSEGSSSYESNYSGIDAATGQIQDTGVVYMTMPQGSELPAGTVVSPIVGVVQRQGDWSITNPNYLLNTDLSNAITGDTPTGSGDYDGSSMTLNLSNGTDQYSATVDYTVLDTDTIVLDPFVLQGDGLSSYSMAESVLIRDDNRFYGILTNLEAGASYDSLLFSIDLDSIPDLDGDSIPDISDPAVLDLDSWAKTAVGWVRSFSEDTAYSIFMGWVSLEDYPFIYHYELGWLRVMPAPLSQENAYWMYSPSMGWIYTQSNWGGDFFKHSGSWVLDNFLNPNP